jgi:hypothetical protein
MGEETDISIELATDIYVERLHAQEAKRTRTRIMANGVEAGVSAGLGPD